MKELQDSEKLKDNFDRSVAVVADVLGGKPVSELTFLAARVTFATYSKLKQSEVHKEGLLLAAVRDFSIDKKELRRLIKLTVPDIKLIPDKT